MRFGTLCALAMLAGASLVSQSRADDPTPGGNWLGRWFSLGKQADRKDVEGGTTRPLPPPVIDARAEALAAFHRRSAVCMRLREIAIENKDEALNLEVDRLEKQIWDHYLQLASRER